jgi:hypothetical protein
LTAKALTTKALPVLTNLLRTQRPRKSAAQGKSEQ